VNKVVRDKWVVPKWIHLQWRQWDDEYVVFNPASGHTHVLNWIGAEALKALEKSPSSSKDVMRRISECAVTEDASALLGQLDKLFAEFDELGLIERAHR
jgi:PqqD family protein of HPr-rel-A system